MAFDLNKNDGSVQDASNKTAGTSKFDLTKGEAAGTTVPPPASGSKTWIIALAGILVVGGGIWYYSSRTDTAPVVDFASTTVSARDSANESSTKAQTGLVAAVNGPDPVAADSSATAPASPIVTTADDVPATAQPASGNANSAVAKLNNKIPATFGQGSASFSRIDQSLIKQITSYLSKNPGASIQVNGYASSDGTLAINQTISQARADAFKRYLVSKSIAEDRVVATGKGIENPIASNDTNAGRKKNRRVEITFP